MRALRVIEEGLWEWDAEQDTLWVSPRWKEMLGCGTTDSFKTLGTWQQLIHPDDTEAFLTAWLACKEGRAAELHIEYRIRRKEGTYVWVRTRGRCMREAGGPLRIAGAQTDISPRKQSEDYQARYREHLEEAVRARTRELEMLRETSDAVVSELDLGKLLRLVAEKARRLIAADTILVPILNERRDSYQYVAADGAHAGEIMGTCFSIQTGMCGWVLRHGKALLYGADSPWIPDDGEPTPWEQGHPSALLVPLFSKGAIVGGLGGLGKQGGGSFLHRDLELLTVFANQVSVAVENASLFEELKGTVADLEQRVQERTADLEASNKELEAFAYSVSHDLRAPLRSIDGFGLALLEDYGDALAGEGKVYLDRLRANTQRMGELIDALLELSRITRTELSCEPVDLSRLASDIAGELSKTAGAPPVDFVAEQGLSCQGDPRLLRIAFENLLANAWKFTAKVAHPRVEFGHCESDGTPAYYVRDNGAGFDMAYAGKLFDAFQRLHSASDFPGTGIGLATVKRIVARHHGRVWAHAGPGAGATFYFTIG
ncbi:MAG: PAS domain-containing protein [Betaproteobacteria bacterium]|nr:PAS domain-containing protein [Betaproteobacteria bacterium]